MADLTITPANVLTPEDARPGFKTGVAGASITAGMVLYFDAVAGTYKPAHCETSAATAQVRGIALHAALAGQPIKMQTRGLLAIGATVVVSKAYVLSGSGLICPEDDLATGDWVTYLGYGATSTQLMIEIKATGLQKPA